MRGSGVDSPFEAALAVWHRRKWLMLVVFAASLTVAVAVVRSLPDIYQSTATVLIEHQKIAERFVGSSVTGELETRLHTLSQEILSRSRMRDLIARLGLYPELRGVASPDMVAERMRRDITLEFKEVRESAGREATIAFDISYRGRDPDTVARVTNALAALFVEENARIRERQTTGTTQFLRHQMDEAKRNLDQQEQRVKGFKVRYGGELPERQLANAAAIERLTTRLRMNMDAQFRTIERRDDLLSRPTEPRAVVDSPDPALARLRKLREDLADLRQRLTDEHPDIVRLKAQIADLERQLAAASPTVRTGPADPSARQRAETLTRLETELRALRSEEESLRAAIAAYERQVEGAPQRAQELDQLTAGYESAKERYQVLLTRYEEARLAERLEEGQQGEQFRILDPALSPTGPVAPNRMTLLVLGLMFSIGSALGLAMLAEARDTSFHTVHDLRAFTSVPVLVSIPPIVTRADAGKRRWQMALSTVVIIAGIAAIGSAASHLARDNEMIVRLLAPSRF